jgi:hypothetical protein
MSARAGQPRTSLAFDGDTGESPRPSVEGLLKYPPLGLLGGTTSITPSGSTAPRGFQAWMAVNPMPRCAAAWYAQPIAALDCVELSTPTTTLAAEDRAARSGRG